MTRQEFNTQQRQIEKGSMSSLTFRRGPIVFKFQMPASKPSSNRTSSFIFRMLLPSTSPCRSALSRRSSQSPAVGRSSTWRTQQFPRWWTAPMLRTCTEWPQLSELDFAYARRADQQSPADWSDRGDRGIQREWAANRIKLLLRRRRERKCRNLPWICRDTFLRRFVAGGHGTRDNARAGVGGCSSGIPSSELNLLCGIRAQPWRPIQHRNAVRHE